MDSAQPMTLAPELIELVTEGKLLLLEARDTDGHVRHALLSAPHISSASWQIVEHVPTPTDQVLWRPTGAPAD